MACSFSLKRSKKLFFVVYQLFEKKRNTLSVEKRKEITECLTHWQEAIVDNDLGKGEACHRRGVSFLQKELKKTIVDHIRDTCCSLVFALVFATLVRSLWFEFFEIPTGSMRPTLKEQDRLMVTKTAFGINFPLHSAHLLLEPSLLQRGGIVTFTGADMDIPNNNTRYFYLFPGKKQYVKRLIGKPGDTLYFYGGKVYGIDREGRDISAELHAPILETIDHVPYIYFDGRVELSDQTERGMYRNVIIKQMNQPVAQLHWEEGGAVVGKSLPPYEEVAAYSDLWGIKHYAKVRLLRQKDLRFSSYPYIKELPPAPLYLEIAHHPSFKPAFLERDLTGRFRPTLSISYSIIPLGEKEGALLLRNLYTARFRVKNGVAKRLVHSPPAPFLPKIEGVPDGTYEFYRGKGEQILFGGIAKPLPDTHPLYSFSVERAALLFNLGMDWSTLYQPDSGYKDLFPPRYAYYREGDLYVMGEKFLGKESPILTGFIEEERARAKNASSYQPYAPFVDIPPPFSKENEIDHSFLKKYGVRVPEKTYLVLGDNYAGSADSRDFGFVPEDNIRGAPDFIFWPPGSRWGKPLQPPYPFFNFPRLLIWILAGFLSIFYVLYRKRKRALPVKIRSSS